MSAKTTFLSEATRLTNDLVHRERIHTGMWKYYDARARSQGFFQDWQQARILASQTKKAAISRLSASSSAGR
jgi:L-lactate utilization protein LutB